MTSIRELSREQLLARADLFDDTADSLMPAARKEYQSFRRQGLLANDEGEPMSPRAIAAVAGLRDAAKRSRDLAATQER